LEEFEYNRPNTRARIAARRKRTRVPQNESGVLPGPRRALGGWFATGKIAGLLLFVAGAFGLWLVSTSPRFTVRDVHVEGAQALGADEVRGMAGAVGESIWLVDTARITERLHQSAYVEQAGVRVELPDRLAVSIRERRPELRWQAGGVNFLVAADGRVLGADQTMALTNTLVIEDRSGRPLEPNDRVDADALTLSQLIAVRLPEELNLHPAGIVWDVPTGVFITTAEGQTIVFGQKNDFDRKLAILGLLLEDGTSFSYLDLRSATPFYRSDGSGKPEEER
jgi:cell division protein FtsQ